MNDIFISYAREDKPQARRLALALEERGWRVWWDAEIPPGETWDEVIERELTAAKAVIVLWSATSVKKRWVKTEASLALDANKLLPVLIDSVLPPIAFRPIQAASLVDWQGDPGYEGFAQLLAQVERMAGAPAAAAGLAEATPPPVLSGADPLAARKQRWSLFVGAGGAAAAAAIAGLLLFPGAQAPDKKDRPADPGVADPGVKVPVVTPPSELPRTPPAEVGVPPAPAAGALPGRYPQASERLLTDADLSGLSADELRLMRNEIFARRGYIFNDPGLRDYFQAQSWYRPLSRDDVKLSALEQANVAKIRAFEQDVGKLNR